MSSAREALQELVACEDDISLWRDRQMINMTDAELNDAKTKSLARHEAAWAAARGALALPTAQEPPADPNADMVEHERGILADLDAIVADKREDFWPVALALGTARMIRQRDAALEAQRGEIANAQTLLRDQITRYYGMTERAEQAEADARAARADADKGWELYRLTDQAAQQLRKDLTAARELAEQLWAVVRAADSMRDLIPVGKNLRMPLSILGPDARIARRYDDERAAVPKDAQT